MLKLKKKAPKLKKVSKESLRRKETKSVEEVGEIITPKYKTLEQLMKEACYIEGKCDDFELRKVSKETLRLNEDKTITYTPEGKSQRNVGISRFALSQLGTKIGVPSNYLDKCFDKGRADIAQYNVNEWVDEYKGGLFIREYDDEIRGVLSPKYSVCDLPEVIGALENSLDLFKFSVRGSYISPERFHCRVVENDRLNVDGEDLFVGVSVDSSDVGRSTLSVKFIVWKQICSNGLIVPRSNFMLFKQKHIGVTADAFRESLTESLTGFETLSDRVCMMIERTRNSDCPYDFDVEDEEKVNLVDNIRRQFLISPQTAGRVVDIMQDGRYEQNRWGYVNALTEAAQSLTLEKRIDLEERAGRLLIA